MSYWRNLFIVMLLTLTLPVQSFAAVSMKCVLADADAGEAPLGYAEHDVSEHHLALRAVSLAGDNDNDHDHHCDSRCGHSCSICASGCCFGIPLAAVLTVGMASSAMRVVIRRAPSAGTVSFLTGGIERPPRYTLV